MMTPLEWLLLFADRDKIQEYQNAFTEVTQHASLSLPYDLHDSFSARQLPSRPLEYFQPIFDNGHSISRREAP